MFFAVMVERFDRGLRTKEQVRLALGLPVLAAIPLVAPRRLLVLRAAIALVGGRHGRVRCRARVAAV